MKHLAISFLSGLKKATTIVLLLVVVCFVSYAQEADDNIDMAEAIAIDEYKTPISIEREQVEFRIPSNSCFEKYRNQSRFKYVNKKTKEEKPENTEDSWFTKVLENIIKFLGSIFSSSLFVMLFAITVAGLILYLVLRYCHFDFKSILKKNKELKSDIDSYLEEEDVKMSQVDMDINQAIRDENYRLALRLLFLKNLKALSDNKIIVWTKDKTNHMYANEIANKDIKMSYQKSALMFDYVWYGEMLIDEHYFVEMHRYMDVLYDKINSHASEN